MLISRILTNRGERRQYVENGEIRGVGRRSSRHHAAPFASVASRPCSMGYRGGLLANPAVRYEKSAGNSFVQGRQNRSIRPGELKQMTIGDLFCGLDPGG